MKKNVLVTGASGFIGYHFATHLRERGDEVIGLDNFNDYYNPQLKRDRAEELSKKGIRVMETDVCDASALQNVVETYKITSIVHLAAQAGVRYSTVNPQAYVKSNLEGFVTILETCRQHQLPLVYASSSSVYGLNQTIPFTTEDRTDQQASLYGATKKANELMAFSYHHMYGLQATGLRFFTVYGPWGRPDMAYFHFTKSILEGKEIDVYNHGNLMRDFTYIDDIVQGTAAALDTIKGYDLYNLGNHRPVALQQFIEILEDTIGIKAKKRHLPMQVGDVMATYADIEKSQAALGFSPTISLEKGIPLFFEWFKNYYKV